ncbi:GTPase IMAP family member 8-like [Plectropomus leopardus]|uniref:GTPase IMAP family member 8-like n=1 Tax=Plectropomus leopardus TaxID=160734 RepID=UPI001C4D4B73|nr:GTPase IMAP family member 8-like [Plectropomus leopardus]
MSQNGKTNKKQTMVVMSTVEGWLSLKDLQEISGDKHLKITFRSLESHQICDMTVGDRLVSLHYADLKQDMTEEGISQAMDGCFRSCRDGIRAFLLLIQGGHYTKRERRMVEVLQAHFGVEALKYLVLISLEDGKVADTMDDALLELIKMCDGRYCRITSSEARQELRTLLEMVDSMLAENSAMGYTESMLTEAKKMSTEDSAMKMLKQKVQEVEEKEQAFKQLVQQQEERRAREMEELKAKHAEERKKEAAEKKHYESKRESLEEAVISHRAMLQLQMNTTDDNDNTKKTSVILLGLSGSGKSSALNLILERAGNQYSVSESSHDPPQPTLYCQRKEVFAGGKRIVLVDTPELWDEDGVENLQVVKDCLALSLPGPHAFLLVLQVGRFTQGECEMLWHLQKIFGKDFAEHAIILLVQCECNQHKPQKIDDYVAGAHATLQDLIRKCGSRYYELNVTKYQNALSYPQVKDLLSGVNKLVASHGGRSYSVRRFSVQELQERKKVIGEKKEGALEVNYLLRDA